MQAERIPLDSQRHGREQFSGRELLRLLREAQARADAVLSNYPAGDLHRRPGYAALAEASDKLGEATREIEGMHDGH